jgi:hypothetical protein
MAPSRRSQLQVGHALGMAKTMRGIAYLKLVGRG